MNVYVYELAKALGKLGITVDIFTRSQSSKQPHVVTVDGFVRLFHVPAGPERPFPKTKLRRYLQQFAKNISRIMSEQKLDYALFDAHYYLSGLTALELNKIRRERKPVITTFHTLAFMKNLVARSESEKDGYFRINSEKLLTHESKKIIVPSQNEKFYLEYLDDCPQNKIAVVSPGINADLFKPIPTKDARKATGIPADKKVILFVGRIEPLKGIDVLIYTVKILLKRNRNLKICLVIVGGDILQKRSLWSKELKKLERLKKQLHLESVVHFVGQQPQEKLFYFYNSANVLVMPSHYESFGMTALEAMACGVPVVATNVSGVTGLMDKKEEMLVSSANNPLLLAQQLENLLNNPGQYQKIKLNLPSEVKKYTWSRTAAEILKIYQQVIYPSYSGLQLS